MMVRQKFFAAMMALFVAANSASAASITYSILPGSGGDGTFDLLAQVSNDTFGLTYYAVELFGATTIDHNSPVAGYAANVDGPIGFNFARSANGCPVVSAAQDVTNPDSKLIYNIGVLPGSLDDAPFGPALGAVEGRNYGTAVVLASGTYDLSSGLPKIGRVDGLVFTDRNGHFAQPDQFFPFDPPPAEPAVEPPVPPPLLPPVIEMPTQIPPLPAPSTPSSNPQTPDISMPEPAPTTPPDQPISPPESTIPIDVTIMPPIEPWSPPINGWIGDWDGDVLPPHFISFSEPDQGGYYLMYDGLPATDFRVGSYVLNNNLNFNGTAFDAAHAAAPEPATLILTGLALISILSTRRRENR